MTDPVALRLLSEARMRMLLKDFFFGRLALYLQFREDPSIPTLAVDGKHIFYNPNFVKGLTNSLRTSAIAHEIGHCMLQHFLRRLHRDSKKWNYAGDYVINQILKDSGYKIGADWLLDAKYVGMTAEQVYDLLPDSLSGSALCEIMDGAPPESAESEAQATSWKIAVQAAAIETAKRGGRLPASLKRLLEDMLHPPVPWREVLRRWMTEAVNEDFSWQRPNRKFISSGLYMPRLYNEGMGTLGVVVDTSGSITDDIFAMFVGAIQDICNQAKPSRIVYMAADAEVHETEVFENGQLDVQMLRATGGGGTDFRPALKAMEEHAPAAVIYLTDLYGSYDDEPSYPVLWACTTDQVATWGETLKIEA